MRNPLFGGVLVGALSLIVYGLCFDVAFAATEVNGEIPNGAVWTAAESPYIVTNASIPAGSTLTIEPGVVVKFPPEHGLSVGGSLIAEGSETEKIYFTSLRDDEVGGDTNGDGATTTPSRGDWQQIRIFEGGSAALTHVVIRYGGLRNPVVGLSWCGPNIRFCEGAVTNLGSLQLADSELSSNANYGIFQVNGVSTITGSTLSDTEGGVGVNLQTKGGEMTIESSTISDASSDGVVFDEETIRAVLNNNTFSGNGSRDILTYAAVDFSHENNNSSSGPGRGIYILGSLDQDTTWTKDSIPYVIERDVVVPEGQTLTINPGVVVKFLSTSAIVVNGMLAAQGMENEKVYFTSIKDDEVGGDTNGDGGATAPAPRDWTQLRAIAPGVVNLTQTVLRYGGKPYRPGVANCAPGIGWCLGAISSTGILSITDSELADNDEYGVYQVLGSSTIESTNIKNTNGGAVRVDAGTAVIHQSSLADNVRGLDVGAVTETVNAENNWWGSDTGPLHTTLNATGTGVIVSGDVDFAPWLKKDPFAPEEPLDPLLLQYEPILYFHPEEDYFPMNVEAFIEESALWSTDGLNDTLLIPRGEVTVDDLADENSEDWYLAFSSDEAKSFDLAIAKERYDQLEAEGKAVPTYYAHKMEQDGWIVLQYWYFYAFNNWKDKLKEQGNNNHEGDWESVFVFLDKELGEPKYIAYSAHHNDGDPSESPLQYDSVRRNWNSTSTVIEGDHVVAFVALGSHANYPKEVDGGYTVPGVFGNNKDLVASNGPHLGEGELSAVSKDNIENISTWTQYRGLWGADSVDTFLGEKSGPRGPAFNDASGVARFQNPVEWAGLDKIAQETADEPTSLFSFQNQLVTMLFSVPVAIGTSIVSDQHDELITFGNLDEIKLLPHFWDFESNLINDTFNAVVTLGYDEDEVSALGLDENQLSVFLYNEEDGVWGNVTAAVDMLANTISFPTTHFSRYAIGAVPQPNTPPTITLLGSSTIEIMEGDIFTDPGVTATDAEDGDLNDQIIVSGLVDVTTPGTYTLIYAITDSGNLIASTSRQVIVTEAPPTAIELLEDFKIAVDSTTLKAKTKRDLKSAATLTQTLIAGNQISLARIVILAMEVSIKLELLQKRISKADAKELLELLAKAQRRP